VWTEFSFRELEFAYCGLSADSASCSQTRGHAHVAKEKSAAPKWAAKKCSGHGRPGRCSSYVLGSLLRANCTPSVPRGYFRSLM